ncbi:aspartate-ammonia ligase [Bacillus sp. OV322]|uniref:aspartate--ammonia ligase n=1 Tax=Bacillus sp. OV322 TaxID=1882764 RepID=UPI0008E4A167|nr:aspartate--ammonia ligase [Bacillus sp. OV322]SFC01038.1 aspartate-ammonia ligase [Bacillus sp. OV322]
MELARSLELPRGYRSALSGINTEKAIKLIKNHFENALSQTLNLTEVFAPLLLDEGTGLNDNLNGIEKIVSFDAKDVDRGRVEIVQSLAKWKRAALSRYGFMAGEGLYTNMKAVRGDEELDNLHSLYVDQWDWEKVITKENRSQYTLKDEVRKIFSAIKLTENHLYKHYPEFQPILPNDIYFVSSQELEEQFPELSPKQREDAIAKEHGAVFIMQIGGFLKSGRKHDGRSPDYDDWTLNGDIIFWNPLLEKSFEVSSMGIRVDEKSLLRQLRISRMEERRSLEFHQSILSGKLPYTIGGGIGQSRLCMFLLRKAHIGEVQASVWNEREKKWCLDHHINLL